MSRAKLLVFGGSGQLGQTIQKHPDAAQYEIVAPTSAEVDLRDAVGLLAFVERMAPDFAFNCAAYTAVDRAESERDVAFAINGVGAGNVATACARVAARLIHTSTDYVFSGDRERPYRETDPTAPINVYGASKLEGERLVLLAHPTSVVLRVSWLFAAAPSSFVSKILVRARSGAPLRVVSDQRGCPTSAEGLADVMFRLIDGRAWHPGVYHYCGNPPTTWFGFAEEIVRQSVEMGILAAELPIAAIRSVELGAPARRPANSVIDSSKLCGQLGIGEDVWRDRLKGVLQSLARDIA